MSQPLKLKRIDIGSYKTADGQYRVWRMVYCGRWYVGNPDIDDYPILEPAGYPTKWEAKAALERYLEWLKSQPQ